MTNNEFATHFGAAMNAQMRRRLALQIAASKHGLPVRFVDGVSESVGKRITASETVRTRSRRTRRAIHAAAAAREQSLVS